MCVCAGAGVDEGSGKGRGGCSLHVAEFLKQATSLENDPFLLLSPFRKSTFGGNFPFFL